MVNLISINQAVILCGGLGSRLRPLTNRIPKPMARIADIPFLAYLVHQLRCEGISRFVLLTGYKSKLIEDYFQDGQSLGVKIAYSQGPADWLTGERLWHAKLMLDETFMLLYADNYLPFNITKLKMLHQKSGSVLSCMVAKKKPGNTMVACDGHVQSYNKKTKSADSQHCHVELGYMLINRDRYYQFYQNSRVDLCDLMSKIALAGQMSALSVVGSYYSISDLPRLEKMRQYLPLKKIILLDRDGIINIKPPRGCYVCRWSEFEWIEKNIAGLMSLAKKGFKFIVVTNQAGVGREMLSESDLNEIHRRMVDQLKKRGIDILDIFVCPHHWDEGCECRKPKAGMFAKLSDQYALRLDRTVYIGDDLRDCKAAYNASVKSAFIGHQAALRTLSPEYMPLLIADSIDMLQSYILDLFSSWENMFYPSPARHAVTG